MIIEHLGRTINTQHYNGYVDKKIVDEVRCNFYNEDKERAITQLSKVLNGGFLTNDIYSYYFERVANDTRLSHVRWSINEFLQSDELIHVFYQKTLNNKKVFTSDDIVKNIKTAIRLGPAGMTAKPTQFPIKVMRNLLDKFTNEGDMYYDPCCGWGMRMMCAAEKGLHYVGNDVNYDLMVKLKELKEDIQSIKNFDANLIYEGAQVFQPSLENRVDFIFTSPPYFDLEVYSGSEELENTPYDNWLNEFIRPMLENCFRYIKNNKNVAINIKNGKKNMLYDDTLQIAKSLGFNFVGEMDLKQNNRVTVNPNRVIGDSSEKIMILQKVEDF